MTVFLQVVSAIALSTAFVGLVEDDGARWLGLFLLACFALLFGRALMLGARLGSASLDTAIDRVEAALERHGGRERWFRRWFGGYARHAVDLVSLVLGIAALVASGFVILDSTRVKRTFASAYDVTDPFHERCSNATGGGPSTKLLNRRTTLVRDAERAPIGRLEVIYSIYCGTAWPRFRVSPRARGRLRGRFVRLAIERISDHATAAYVLPLRGGALGWGNMIAQQDSCVVAEAQLLRSNGRDAGPLVRTKCVTG